MTMDVLYQSLLGKHIKNKINHAFKRKFKPHELNSEDFDVDICSESTPTVTVRGDIVPISDPDHENRHKKRPNNHRSIPVTTTLSRPYGRILRDQTEEEYQEKEEQCRFRAQITICLKHSTDKKLPLYLLI